LFLEIIFENNLPYIQLPLTENLIDSKFLVDTGSVINLMKLEEVKRLGAVKINFNDRIVIIGVDNMPMETIGSFETFVVVQELKFPIKFQVVNDLIFGSILGGEFLRRHVKIIGEDLKYIVLKGKEMDEINEYQIEEYEECFDDRDEVDEELKLSEKLEDIKDFDIMEARNIAPKQERLRQEELLTMIELSHLAGDAKIKVEEILKQNSRAFFINGDSLTFTTSAMHEIETTTNVPIYKRQYRFPEATKSQINDEIEEMLKHNIIKPSKSPWNAPVLCVPKKKDENGTMRYRIVVDFRSLNTITKPFIYPIPLITDILDSLGNSQYFSTLDLKSGFYQVPIHPRDATKTAFSTPKGHFEFTRMPMGLKNSPSTFQKLMNTVIYELGNFKALVYLDDIIVAGDTIEEHNENLAKVLEALVGHNLKVETKKCKILKNELEFLGHVINKEGVKPTRENVKAIEQMKHPGNIRELRSFLGTINFYAKFIENIAEIRKPLNELLRKDTVFSWTKDCENAFEQLKRCLMSEPLLVRPNYRDRFVITTDASLHAIGAVLSNETNMERPIAYASRSLGSAERKYHTIEKELLAIVWAVDYFKHYIFGQKFIIYTDHRPLVSLWSLNENSSTLTRLRLRLQGIECEIRYKKGKENIVADFLSRLPHENEKDLLESKKDAVAIVTRQQTKKIIREQINNELGKKSDISEEQEDNHWDNLLGIEIDDKMTEQMEQRMERKIKSNRVDKSKYKHFQPDAERIEVDESEVETLLKEFHDAPLGGHVGVRRMKKRIREMFYWKNMYKDIERYVRSCKSCQINKICRYNRIPMQITTTSTTPLEKLYIDIVILPESESGNKYGLVMQDDLTRYLLVVPLPNQEAKTVAKSLIERVICVHGTPKEIVTDQGTNFMSEVMKNMCKFLKIKKLILARTIHRLI